MLPLCLSRGRELSDILQLPNSAPSSDTFERVMQTLDPKALQKCLQLYGAELIKSLKGVQLVIDGKKIRGINPLGRDPVVTFSQLWTRICRWEDQWDYTRSISFGQPAIEGAMVTMDSMGTQRVIAEKIIEKQADYILSLRDNQPYLFEDVSDAFSCKSWCKNVTLQEKGHRRIDTHKYGVPPFVERVCFWRDCVMLEWRQNDDLR